MRTLLACLVTSAVLPAAVAHAQITSFPFLENFESDAGNFLVGGANSSWQWGVPDDNYIMAAGQGERCWVTNLDGPSFSNSLGFLQSPEFDFTGFTEDPTLQFLHSYEWNSSDEAWILVSFDGGPYEKLLTDPVATSLNWYNDTTNEWWDGNSGGSGQWDLVRHPITGAAGKKATLRWRTSTGSFPSEDGWAVDQVQVFDDLVDLQAFSLDLPDPGTELGQETLTMSVRNLGSDVNAPFDVQVDVEGPIPTSFVETVPVAMAPLQVGVFQLITPVDFSADGDYVVTVTVLATGDSNPDNDSLSGDVRNEKIVSEFPYVEDFENGPGGFFPGGDNPTWEFGLPASSFIFGAASGVTSWVTNLDGEAANAEFSYLQTPEFDFTGLQNDPFVEFSHIFQMFSFGDSYVDYSINGGQYQRLGSSNSPASLNWYTGSFSTSLTWEGSSGLAGEWRTARHIVPGGAGRVVTFRIYLQAASSSFSSVGDGVGIDDFRVYEAPLGSGQAPLPSQALLDINESQEVLGFFVENAQPGPYFATASPESGFSMRIEGPSFQPVVLFMGKLATNAAFIPEVGQVDIDQVQVFASGLLPGGLNPFFVTNSQGEFSLAFSVPTSLVGGGATFQALTLDPFDLPKLTNAVQVSFVP